jgi:5'-methylthioadenosine phosphorylase
MPRIGIIGGTGLENLLEGAKVVHLDTPYGTAPPISVGFIDKEEVAFLPRHGPKHDLPPHKVNYRANLYSLKRAGVERIIATNAVGAMNPAYNAGDLVIPLDLLDMTKCRASTYFDAAPVTHIDVTEPYCPQLRKILIECCKAVGVKAHEKAILAVTEGPRYETPAEICMLQKLGGDLVGMTGSPEAFLARELEICYATVCFVSNMAAGMQQRLSHAEVIKKGKEVMPAMLKVIRQAAGGIPITKSCSCNEATRQGQV